MVFRGPEAPLGFYFDEAALLEKIMEIFCNFLKHFKSAVLSRGVPSQRSQSDVRSVGSSGFFTCFFCVIVIFKGGCLFLGFCKLLVILAGQSLA